MATKKSEAGTKTTEVKKTATKAAAKTTTKTAAKTTAAKTAAKPAAKTAAAKAAPKKAAAKKVYAYVFFNCDDEKNQTSMNIRYNNEVFADKATSRKSLLDTVMHEVKAGRVNLADKDQVTEAILKGDPREASKYMQYGVIERVIMH